MKSFWTKAALAAAAVGCMGVAHASTTSTIDFENVDSSNAPSVPFVYDLDSIRQAGYSIGAYDPHNAGNAPDGGFVGALVNGGDTDACQTFACPHGNTSNFLDVINDGVMFLNHGGVQLTLNSFDAAFLPPSGLQLPSSTVAFLAIEADRADSPDDYTVGIFALRGPTSGDTSFASFLASNAQIIHGPGTLTSGDVTRLFAYTYYCDSTSGNCSFGGTNRGQFAIDNISITAVPEPSSWLLLAVGLGALGVAARRRRSA